MACIFELDKKDKRLLFELDMNARQTNAQLARKIGLSKQAVAHRIDRLLKDGVIKGFYPVIDVPKLGYLYCRIMITLKDISEPEYNQMVAELVADKRFFWIFSAQGTSDLLLVTWAKTVTALKETMEDLLIRYGRFIERYSTSLATDVIHYQHRYLLDKVETEEIHIIESDERAELDDLDKKILIELCDDARALVTKIAGRVGASSRSVAYRIQRLLTGKMIRAFRTVIDHNRLGYTYFKLWIDIHNFTRKELSQIREYVKNNPATVYQVEGVGLPEYLDIEIMVRSNIELQKFIKDLRGAFPHIVGHYSSFMFLDTLKVRYYPF